MNTIYFGNNFINVCDIHVACIPAAYVQHIGRQLNRLKIIFFLVDDMGWQDCFVPFWTKRTFINMRYHTSNMERLAKEGMKFTNAYATPVCTPTRVSYLTGMNEANHGVTNWTSPWKNSNTANADDQMEPVLCDWNGLITEVGIPKTVYATRFPQLLNESGYFTIHVGKAHFTPMKTAGANSKKPGFMVNFPGSSAGHPQG